MNEGKSHERRQCLHRDMTGYDWLWLVHAIMPLVFVRIPRL